MSSQDVAIPTKSQDSRSAAPALDRGLKLLRFLRNRRNGASVGEMAEKLGIPPASAYRLANTLELHRFIVKNRDDGRYRLGSQILLLAGAMLGGLDLRSLAHPHLEDLHERTDETVELCVLESGHLVVIDKIEGEESVHIHNIGGHRSPLVDSTGLALLAGLRETRAREVVEQALEAHPRKTVYPVKKLNHVFEQVREKGLMSDEGPEFDRLQRRSRRIAMPIRDHLGATRGAVGLVVAVSRWSDSTNERRRRLLGRTVRRINELMGFQEQVDRSG